MKKILALALAAMMVLSMAACGNTNNNDGTTTTPVVETSALEIMNNIWALYTDPATTPFVMGGSVNAEGVPAGDGVPGNYDISMVADLSGILYVPAEETANIDDAATAMHAMMANNFTAGVLHVTSDATAFANTMTETLKNNQWICGQPETLIVAVIHGEYVLVGFGVGDLMSGFIANMTAAYPEATVVFNGALA